MNPIRTTLILSALLMITLSGFFAIEITENYAPVMDGLGQEETEENETETETSTLDGIMDGILSGIGGIINVIVEIILTPFRALASIFSSWGQTVSGMGVWAPVLAVVVILVIMVLIRTYSQIDSGFDRIEDWLNPGNEG